jgi:carbamoyl-phosphate synthase small subunit
MVSLNVAYANCPHPGLIHASRPIFSTQFHPEAKGGPLDSSYLFDMYMDNVHKYKEGQSTSQPYRDSKPSPLLVDLLAKERVGVDLTQGIRNMMASTTQEPERVYAAGAA